MTMRPPMVSCSSSAGGTRGPEAVTTTASNGACSGKPSVPSPTMTCTLQNPSPASRAAARSASRGWRSMV